MRLTTLSLGFILSLFAFSAIGGSGHDHSHSHAPVNQEQATINATKYVAALVKRDKLEKSWESIHASSVEKKVFKGNPEWVAVFINKEIADPTKRTLYIYLTMGGDYIAANYTGE